MPGLSRRGPGRRARRAGPALGAAAALALLAACGVNPPTVRSQTYTQGRETRELDIRKVAIAPFRAAEAYPRTGGADMPAAEAVQLVERFVSEALMRRGVQVVPPGDVRTVLRITDPEQALPPPSIVTQVADREFGVPAVLYGKVYRMRDRARDPMGVTRPASVWYEVTLVRAPGGQRVWASTFNETQRPLNENVFNASRYPGGGTRWLSAEELARWGATGLANDFPTSLPPLSSR